jgi:hypothetical protein
MPDIKTFNPLRPVRFALALTALMFAWPTPGLAADWGYDDMSGAHTEAPSADESAARPAGARSNGPRTTLKSGQKAKKNSGRSNNSQTSSAAAAPGQTRRKPPVESDENSLSTGTVEAPAKAPGPEEIAARKKVEELKSWMEVFALAASSSTEDDRNQILTLGTLPADTRKKLEKMTFEKLDQNLPEYLGITAVWKPLSQKIAEDIDYKESYRLLFRSLLRHAVSRIEATAPEAEAIQELLGPARIAEMGPPILTEDAINAYSDMTCFLYQKRHPDHTVEGDDNRQLFAEVIRQKYTDAPNPAAKKAMCNFDVTWASFRCRYLDANAAEKDKLITTISGEKGDTGAASQSGANSQSSAKTVSTAKTKKQATAALMSPKLLKIFALGPWAESSKTIPVAVKMSQMSEPTK